MSTMRSVRRYLLLLFVCLAPMISRVETTCVLESDFGFTINCAFKKSGLFRVRNLGGIKAHVGLGFSVGDELGFGQSLTNLDPSRRRSVSVKSGVPNAVLAGPAQPVHPAHPIPPPAKQEKRGKQNRLMVRQPSPNPPPKAPGSTKIPNFAAMKAAMANLHHRGQAPTTMQPIVVPSGMDTPTMRTNVPKLTLAKPLPMSVPPFRPLPPKDNSPLNVLPITSTRRSPQISQAKGPGLAYSSENYTPRILHDQVSKMVSQMTASQLRAPHYTTANLVRITPSPIIVENYYTPSSNARFPAFQTLPNSINQFVPMPVDATPVRVTGISIVPAPTFKDSIQIPLAPSMMPKMPSALSFTQNTLAIRNNPSAYPTSDFVDSVPHELPSQIYPVYSQNNKKLDDYNTITGYGDDAYTKIDLNDKITEIAKAGNISMEAVEAAIVLRQQQLLSQYANIPVPTTTSSTTTTTTDVSDFQPEPELSDVTPKQQKRYPMASGSAKVMNAPREYYPVGYEKNFDDKFESKVELPETSFYCGDQKYFPGLYADEHLGCMVFHVCALTDDGLVMKSFLCPESTLFDQTILKCNWWFYVDCKNSKQLYDTNIPVSKSYQLMKALTFFSSYKKEQVDDAGHTKNPEDIEGIKEAISILENQQDPMRSLAGANIEVITARSHYVTPDTRPTTIRASSAQYNNSNNHRINREFRKNPSRYSNNVDSDISDSNIAQSAVTYFDNKFSSTEVSTEVNSKERKAKRKQNLHSNKWRSTISAPAAPTTTVAAPTSSTTTVAAPTSSTTTVAAPTSSTTTTPTSMSTTTSPTSTATSSTTQITAEMTPSSPVVSSELNIILKPVLQTKDEHEYNTNDSKNGSENSMELRVLPKELSMVKNEKVQIVRPTPVSELVGAYLTPTATNAALDEAVLGATLHSSYTVQRDST